MLGKKKCSVCKETITQKRGKISGTHIKVPDSKNVLLVCSLCQSKLKKEIGDKNLKKAVLNGLDN